MRARASSACASFSDACRRGVRVRRSVLAVSFAADAPDVTKGYVLLPSSDDGFTENHRSESRTASGVAMVTWTVEQARLDWLVEHDPDVGRAFRRKAEMSVRAFWTMYFHSKELRRASNGLVVAAEIDPVEYLQAVFGRERQEDDDGVAMDAPVPVVEEPPRWVVASPNAHCARGPIAYKIRRTDEMGRTIVRHVCVRVLLGWRKRGMRKNLERAKLVGYLRPALTNQTASAPTNQRAAFSSCVGALCSGYAAFWLVRGV